MSSAPSLISPAQPGAAAAATAVAEMGFIAPFGIGALPRGACSRARFSRRVTVAGDPVAKATAAITVARARAVEAAARSLRIRYLRRLVARDATPLSPGALVEASADAGPGREAPSPVGSRGSRSTWTKRRVTRTTYLAGGPHAGRHGATIARPVGARADWQPPVERPPEHPLRQSRSGQAATSTSFPSASARVHQPGACSSLTMWPPAASAAATRASA